MFPLAVVPVGPEYLIKFQKCCLMPLFHCTGGGGFGVSWENKACKYVHKYFFVFLSIQFLSIVFLSTANSLQTTNYLIFI